MHAFGDFLTQRIPKLESYGGRVLTQTGMGFSGDTSDIGRSDVAANYEWFREIKIGLDKLFQLEGSNLIEAISRDNSHGYMQIIREQIAQGWPLEFYLSRGMDAFLAKAEISWNQVRTPPPSIADQFDDKLNLRYLGERLEMRHAFPAWQQASTDYDAVAEARELVLKEAASVVPTDTVFLKVHDFDGGVGIFELRPETPDYLLRAFLREHEGHNLIVDAGYPQDEFKTEICSVKILFTERSWQPVFFTKMSINNNSHEGNTIAIGENLLTREVENLVLKTSAPLINEACESGYGHLLPRTACIDFLVVYYKGKIYIFLLEWNARTSAADYAAALLHQALPRFGGKKVAVVMKNLKGLPEGVRFNELRDNCLRGTPWDGTSKPGFVLANAGCLEQGKITAFTIAKRVKDAERMMAGLMPQKAVEQSTPILRASA